MSERAGQIRWIAVDWGTSNLRVWLMGDSARPMAQLSSDTGAGGLAPEKFEAALLALVGPELPSERPTPVIVCGMAGSRQGWAEAAYHTVPCKVPGASDAVRAPTTDQRLDVRILPGIRQTKPADVMRGEETQIAGFLSANPGYDGVICLPGTHTKWVHISAAEVVSFQTFMTGELFALLSQNSMLRHSVNGAGWNDQAFEAAVSDAMSRPQGVAANLFNLRAEGLVNNMENDTARARLSGLLIGMELAASRPYWLGQNVVMIGSPKISAPYIAALSAQGVAVGQTNADDMVLAGLARAYSQIHEVTE